MCAGGPYSKRTKQDLRSVAHLPKLEVRSAEKCVRKDQIQNSQNLNMRSVAHLAELEEC